jgi:hypothetical protein
VDFIENKYRNKATRLIQVSTFVFNERSQNLLKKMGCKLWYLRQTRWPTDDNIFIRQVENKGLDVLEPTGFKAYK